MKKVWKKFKHWLIKKLGGHIEPTHIVEHHTIIPEILTQELSGIKLHRYKEDPKYKEYIHEVLLHKLGDYLYENRERLVDIQESIPTFTDPLDPTIGLRAVIKVCPIPRRDVN